MKPGDRGEQFAGDIAGERRQMFVAKAGGQVVAYGRVLELAGWPAGARCWPCRGDAGPPDRTDCGSGEGAPAGE